MFGISWTLKKLAAPAIEAVQKLFPRLSDYAVGALSRSTTRIFHLKRLRKMRDWKKNRIRCTKFNPTKTQVEETGANDTPVVLGQIMQLHVNEPGHWKKKNSRIDQIR
jgi:hypothetical protein